MSSPFERPDRMISPLDAATIRTPGGKYHLEEDYGDAARAAYQECCKHLRTGALKWAVTDADVQNILTTLRPLSYPQLVAVVHVLGESTDGSTNLLAKLYDRGLETEKQIKDWRRLFYEKYMACAKDGALPDLEERFLEYQRKYVPAKVLERGF